MSYLWVICYKFVLLRAVAAAAGGGGGGYGGT